MRSTPTVFRVVLLLGTAWTFAGCFASSTVLTVKGDGSGLIQQRILVPPAALAQIRGLAARGRPAFDPVPEQQARARATLFGAGVTYLSSAAIDTSDGPGRDITYAFADINHIHLDELPPLLDESAIQAFETINSLVSFALTREVGGNVLLHLHLPQPDLLGHLIPRVSGTQTSPDQMAMLRQMFAGAHWSVAVEPAGDLVRTSGPYVDGRRVTLIDVNLDDVLKDDVTLLRLQAASTPDAAMAALRELPNAKVIGDSEMTIEFTPAQ